MNGTLKSYKPIVIHELKTEWQLHQEKWRKINMPELGASGVMLSRRVEIFF